MRSGKYLFFRLGFKALINYLTPAVPLKFCNKTCIRANRLWVLRARGGVTVHPVEGEESSRTSPVL